MGVSYTVFPLENEIILNWLRAEWSIELAVPITYGRYPSPNEVKNLLETNQEYNLEFYITDKIWQVTISANKEYEWAVITFFDSYVDPNIPHRFYFERGWPELVLQITKNLSALYGTYILLKNDIIPIVITPTTDVKEIAALWDKD